MTIPVIHLFAGPGGLGEGFSRSAGGEFRITISIEKDAMAHETLRLRAAHRELMRNPATTDEDWQLWDALVEHEQWNTLFAALRTCECLRIREACSHADQEARRIELRPDNRNEVSIEIRKRLGADLESGMLPDNVVLIGGPPCQAYSVVGRSRNRGARGLHRRDGSAAFPLPGIPSCHLGVPPGGLRHGEREGNPLVQGGRWSYLPADLGRPEEPWPSGRFSRFPRICAHATGGS